MSLIFHFGVVFFVPLVAWKARRVDVVVAFTLFSGLRRLGQSASACFGC